MLISTAQIRAARGLLNWSQSDLADRTGISATSIGSIENGNTHPREQTLVTIQRVLEDSGVEFTEYGGVQPRRHSIQVYQGTSGLKRFMDDVYDTVNTVGGAVCLFNTIPGNWLKALGEEWCSFHYRRMMEVKDRFTFRAITREDNDLLIGQGFISYKWIPNHLFNDRTFYCFGDKLAFIDFSGELVMVWVIDHQGFADGFRNLFQIAWDHAAVEPIMDSEKDIKK